MNNLTLKSVLEVFDAPINEEQAWAVCYQCANYLFEKWKTDQSQCFRFKRINSIYINKDGTISTIGPPEKGNL